MNKVQIDVWNNGENIYGIISYPHSIGEWYILSHQIKKVSRGSILYGLKGEILEREPTTIGNAIKAGAEDACFSKTLGLMNKLLPYSLQIKQDMTKDDFMRFSFNIFKNMYELYYIVDYLNIQSHHILAEGKLEPQVVSSSVVEVLSIPDLEGKFLSFAINSKHILNELLNLIKYAYKINESTYYDKLKDEPISEKLLKQIDASLSDILFLWKVRNACEHPKDIQYCKIKNFSYKQGKIVNPSWRYKESSEKDEIEEKDLIGKLNYFYDFFLNFTETVFKITVAEVTI